MKIILTTDFSDENKMLFPYAIDLLRLAGGKIIVFHAYMDQFILGDSVFPGGIDSDAYFNREVVIEMENQAQGLMKETVNQLERNGYATKTLIPSALIVFFREATLNWNLFT